jgi:hypothetical protein
VRSTTRAVIQQAKKSCRLAPVNSRGFYFARNRLGESAGEFYALAGVRDSKPQTRILSPFNWLAVTNVEQINRFDFL